MHFIDTVPFFIFLAILLLIAGKTLLLKRKGIRTGSKNSSGGIFVILIQILFIILFLIWFVEIIRPVFSLSLGILPAILSQPVCNSVLLKLTGMFFLCLSLVLMFLTLLHFGSSLRFGLDKNNAGRLIDKGVFSFSRNPFFISLESFFVGTALVITNPVTCGFAFLAVPAIHIFILREEKFMLETYGPEFQEYKKKVRRYF